MSGLYKFMGKFAAYTAVRPDAIYMALSRRLDTLEEISEDPPIEHWAACTRRMKMTPHQVGPSFGVWFLTLEASFPVQHMLLCEGGRAL